MLFVHRDISTVRGEWSVCFAWDSGRLPSSVHDAVHNHQYRSQASQAAATPADVTGAPRGRSSDAARLVSPLPSPSQPSHSAVRCESYFRGLAHSTRIVWRMGESVCFAP
ncbi:hypothetical protein ACJJTC_016867 [Scirpophaga incertulas]